MIRVAPLLCAGVIVATCFACSPTPVAVAPPAPPPPLRVAAVCQPSQPASFAQSVTMLAPGFVPGAFGTPPSSSVPLTAQMQADLTAAFTAAPPIFKIALCRLDGVYVDPSATTSWGYRDPTTLKRYIGLSAQGLWGSAGTTPALAYSAYETGQLAEVMKTWLMPWPLASSQVPTPPFFSPAMSGTTSVDTSAMTVLAVLAHEFGHIFWYDKVKASSGHAYNPNGFCRQHAIVGTGFFDKTWQIPVNQPDPFVYFGAPSGDYHASGIVQLSDLYLPLQNGNYTSAAQMLNSLYTNDTGNASGVWPSLLGAVSPEEDFVETLKLFILTRPQANGGLPITSMPLNIFATPNTNVPTYTPDIFADLTRVKKRELARQLLCIASASP
jgi:hypothetical protein